MMKTCWLLATAMALVAGTACSNDGPVAVADTATSEASQSGKPTVVDVDADNVQEELGQEGLLVALEEVPEAVTSAITTALPLGTIQSVEREIEDGVEIYEAKVTAGGLTYEIKVDITGSVLETESDDESTDNDTDAIENESEGDNQHED